MTTRIATTSYGINFSIAHIAQTFITQVMQLTLDEIKRLQLNYN